MGESSRHVYLRVPASGVGLVRPELPKLGRVHLEGSGTAADQAASWFELTLPRRATVEGVRLRLQELGVSDHVVRVDLLEHLGDGAVQARQVELFQGGPTAPLPSPAPTAHRHRADRQRQAWKELF